MTTAEPSIDIARLEKRRERATKLTARCPACAAGGGDRSGQHFFQSLADGKWGCAARPGDAEHRREIFRLVGICGERHPDPARDRQLREDQRRARQETEARQRLVQTACERRESICERWRWDAADVWEDSPTRIDGPIVDDPRFFISAMFPQAAIIWTGEVYHSGRRHTDRWRTVSEWQTAPQHCVGQMVSPAIWKPGTSNRASENVLAAPFVILDFDELDGRKPGSPTEVEALHTSARAITRWLVEGLKWRLAAIVATGGKSLHCWFHTPGAQALLSLRDTAPALGIDAGLIGHPEHPARLPGQRHAKTEGVSRTLWLQLPNPD